MSEDQIHVISTSTINVESTARINLTPFDLGRLFVEYIQTGLLYRKPGPLEEAAMLTETSTTSLIHYLKASFERTLHFFPPLAGRLTTTRSDDGAATSFFIECSKGGGALFVHAIVKDEANLTVADIFDPSTYIPSIVHSFFPLTKVRNYDGVPQPLMAVQVTELVDGLFIGCSINHLAADGTSFWHFLNCWAEMSRGEIEISKPPFLNRDQVNLDLSGSTNINVYDEHLICDNIESPAFLKDRVFVFTKESVAKLKAKANQEMEVESEGKISSLQAVVAHLWRSIMLCRFDINSATDQETTFEIPVNVRRRLDPPLPVEYFGTAILPGTVTLEARKILANSVGWIAWQINRMAATYSDPKKVKEYYTSWIKKPMFFRSHGLPRNVFGLVHSPRFNVYGNDFGWGKPVAVRSGSSDRSDGRITICGGLEEGSVEIEACLLAETLDAMVKDAEFMEFVTTKY